MKQMTDHEIIDMIPTEIPAMYDGHLMLFANAIIAEFCRINGLTGEAQPSREWVGLTDDEVAKAWAVSDGEHNASASVKRRITRAIESKLREKNAGQLAADDKAGDEAVALPLVITSAPKHIWLDLGFDPAEDGDVHFARLEQVTWSEDNATGNGIKYVRDDARPQPQAEARVPEGYALVPVEPTPEMIDAAVAGYKAPDKWRGERSKVWRTMLAAAPKPEQTK